MVIIRLMGGLGNQLFQYALGRSLEYRHGYLVKYDRTYLDADPLRGYRLDRFDTCVEIANPEEVDQFVRSDLSYFRKKLDTVGQWLRPYHRRRVVVERKFGYDPRILDIHNAAYLIGYWQSNEYFKDIEAILHAELKFKDEPNGANQDLLKQMEMVEAVSIHVRRTDYLSNPKVAQVMAICDLDYYQAAVDFITSRIKDAHFFIFSDDPVWIRENMNFESPITFIVHNGSENDFEDLRLMSRCKHHILANSSFSWWGAWLSNYQNNIVTATRRWFRDPLQNSRYRLPEGWVRL